MWFDKNIIMEKSSSVTNNKSLQDHNNGGIRSVKNGKDQLDSLGDGGDLLGGFSWPPRSYSCTFCKREFRSAQALGGHMNVHRRDRAKLRQMPCSRDLPFHPQNFSPNYTLFNHNLDLNPNCKPKPNPNPNLSPYFSSTFSSTSKLPPLISSSSTTHSNSNSSYCFRPRVGQNLNSIKSSIPPYGICKYDGFRVESEGKIIEKSENIVELNLEIGLLGESKCDDDLDLELRLGCSY